MDSLVDVAWLQANLGDPNLRILDCTVAFEVGEAGALTFCAGRPEWQTGHIPGSAFADIIEDLSDTTSPYQFTLPSAEAFAQAMEQLGVGEGTQVVLYDSTYTMWATRVWWMLKAFGFDDVAVLNGGFTAWQASGLRVSNAATEITPAKFNAQLRPGWFADTHNVEQAVASPGSTCVIDALMPDMYTGVQNPYGRPGHIPGAINVPAVAVVDPESRLFLDDSLLREHFAPALSDLGKAVITYCGGGIAATADAFLLRRLGKSNVAVYDGSMAEWTSQPSRPLVLGAEPQ
ncbi:MAG: thiosulfate/3-mercaptopyruvate sulfurtransferase [Gammaproteobacteria bacterium]|jgi:thiosulfate/3-mercaptopyruvate sulfurtransferase